MEIARAGIGQGRRHVARPHAGMLDVIAANDAAVISASEPIGKRLFDLQLLLSRDTFSESA